MKEYRLIGVSLLREVSCARYLSPWNLVLGCSCLPPYIVDRTFNVDRLIFTRVWRPNAQRVFLPKRLEGNYRGCLCRHRIHAVAAHLPNTVYMHMAHEQERAEQMPRRARQQGSATK